MLQCQVLKPTPTVQVAGNNSIVTVSAVGSQPCSSIEQWVNSPGHLVIVDDHNGCSEAVDESDQVILRLIQNGSCRHHAQQQSMVELQGHPAESFEAFSKLSFRLYRGPNVVPQAKAGKACTSAPNDTLREKSNATDHARTAGLNSPLPTASPFMHVENGDSDKLTFGWLQHVKGFIKNLYKRNSKEARMVAAGAGSDQAMSQSLQLSNAPQDLYLNATRRRHLLAGSSWLFSDRKACHAIFHSCMVVDAGCNAECLTCTGTDRSQCTSCYAGFRLFKGYTGNYCQDCNSNADCVSPAFCNSDSVCSDQAHCDATCATCSGAGQGQCTSCFSGWWLYNGYFGAKYCQNCYSKTDCPLPNSYCGLPDNVCYYCDASCATCSDAGSSSCTSCKPGSVLQSR